MNRRTLLKTSATTFAFGAFPAFAQEATETPATVPDMVMGAEDAPVTVLEYGSFTCPHCAEFHHRFLTPLQTDYIETGKVRFVYRELVRNRVDIWAGMVARCDDAQRYFGVSDMLFNSQDTWLASGDPATIAGELEKVGRAAGFSQETMDVCFTDAELAKAILDTSEANAETDDVTGTPTVFINGERQRLTTYSDFAAAIEALLPVDEE